MRTRSEARRRQAATPNDDPREQPIAALKPTGRWCGVCGEPQLLSHGGPTCVNGHGGAEDVGAVRAAAVRAAVRGVSVGFGRVAADPSTAGMPTGSKPPPPPAPAHAAPAAPADKRRAVEEISGALRDAIKPPPPSPFNFKNANEAKGRPMRADLAKVVETTFVRDLAAEAAALEAALELGEKRSEHAHAIAALDKAATLAYRAHKLYLTSRAAREEWEAENETVFGAMVSGATHDLQREKDSGVRAKQITDADVRARVATLYPDQWRHQEKTRRDVELTVKRFERLAEIFFRRQSDLSALVGKVRG